MQHPAPLPAGWYVTPRQLKSMVLYNLTSDYCYRGDAWTNNNTECQDVDSAPVWGLAVHRRLQCRPIHCAESGSGASVRTLHPLPCCTALLRRRRATESGATGYILATTS